MKYLAAFGAMILFGGLAVLLVNHLSSDAVGMAIGMGLGVLAGLPAALLIIIASRQRAPWNDDEQMTYRHMEGSERVYLRGGGVRPGYYVPASVYPEIDPAPYVPDPVVPVKSVLCVELRNGLEVGRRYSFAYESVESALAAGGISLVRADEWDAWLAQTAGQRQYRIAWMG